MPKIISYTPSWLSRPNPGFRVFDNPKAQRLAQDEEGIFGNGETDHDEYVGPNRTIARRGAEVFVVVGTQIRWADLSLLKEGLEQLKETPSKVSNVTNGHSNDDGEDGPEDGSYRILKLGSIHGPIRQISISPTGKLLAIATSHTVHLAILPDSSHLGQLPNKPMRLKTSTIGRIVHVLSQSPVASILWHPCGVSGSCLVTVTTDATVRLWEFNEGNRYASDTPSLAIDLKKLALGTSEQEVFTPERGRNRAFSSDSAGMEVASACFGGAGSSSESPWSAMTLWIAMRAGDIYALCPLCPSKWQAPDTMLPCLTTKAVALAAGLQEDNALDSEETQQYKDQYTWIKEVDGQEPTYTEDDSGFDGMSPVYRRPEHPNPTPKLQGPFQMTPEENDENGRDDDLELTDIHVIASRIDHESLNGEDDSDSEAEVDESGLSATLVCLMTSSGRVYICLDLEGVEGQWLPRKKPSRQVCPPPDPYLVLLEGLDTLQPNEADESQWPTFSPDARSRYSFFTTHSHSVFFFSLDPWLPSLEKELQSVDFTGIPFRLDVFRNGPGTLRERILSFTPDPSILQSPTSAVPACLAFEDSDLGYFLLTTHNSRPHAATLDRPYSPLPANVDLLNGNSPPFPDMHTLARGPARSAYQPADAFYAPSDLLSFIDHKVPARHKHLLNQQIRLSPATLDLMTEAHRVLGRETYRLGVAAADLFRRCERLIEELKDQIGRVYQCAVRADDVVAAADADTDADDGEGEGGREGSRKVAKRSLEARVQRAREKQAKLQERHEALKKRVHGAGGKKLSEKERAWREEVERTASAIRESREIGAVSKAGGVIGDEEEDEEDEGMYYNDDSDSNDHINTTTNEEDRRSHTNDVGALQQRLQEVQQLKASLMEQAEKILAAADSTLPQNRPQQEDESQALFIPRDLKARKMAQVRALLDRETSMVEAAYRRLERLNLVITAQ